MRVKCRPAIEDAKNQNILKNQIKKSAGTGAGEIIKIYCPAGIEADWIETRGMFESQKGPTGDPRLPKQVPEGPISAGRL